MTDITDFQLMMECRRIINELRLDKQYPGASIEELQMMAAGEVFVRRVAQVRKENKCRSYGEAMDLAAEQFPKEYELYLAGTP